MILGIAAGVPRVVGAGPRGSRRAGPPCADHTLLRCAKAELPTVAAERLRRVRMIVHTGFAAIVLILLCAAITAKGGWV